MTGQLLVFDPQNPSSEAVKPYKVRKSHAKSRAGCKNCKTRRVKCDEARPICGPCSRRSMDCSYLKPPAETFEHFDSFIVGDRALVRQTSSTTTTTNTTLPHRPSQQVQSRHTAEFLQMFPSIWPGSRRTPPILASTPGAFSSNHDLEMLHHINNGFTGPNLFMQSQQPFSIDVLSIASTSTHVMHALLAASALHIQFANNTTTLTQTHTSPSPSSSPIPAIEAAHHLSATTHFRHALALLSQPHTTPSTTLYPEIDPLLTTSMLLNMLSFAGHPTCLPPEARWPTITPSSTSPQDRPLNWLRVQLGFGLLMTHLTSQMRENSQWMRFFMGLGHEVFYDERDGTEGLPELWCGYFGIGEGSQIDRHKYLRVVRRLSMVYGLWMETEKEGHGRGGHDAQVLRYFQFVQGVDEGFVGRLEARDVRSLVVYGTWMGVLCSTSHWWAMVRAVRECEAVLCYLDAVMGPGDVGRGWLGFMARQVGYVLKGG